MEAVSSAILPLAAGRAGSKHCRARLCVAQTQAQDLRPGARLDRKGNLEGRRRNSIKDSRR